MDLPDEVREEYRVYIVGGGTAVLAGWRPATIDAHLSADRNEVFRTFRASKSGSA